MKKPFSIILALSMTVALLCNPALAADRVGRDSPEGFGSTTEVRIKQEEGTVHHKYNVDIIFQTMEFTYTAADKTWNPNTYAYDKDANADGSWGESKSIQIVNHSDLGIRYEITCTEEIRDYGTLEVVVETPDGTVAGCVSARTAQQASPTVSIDGAPNGNLGSSYVKLNEIKVAIDVV